MNRDWRAALIRRMVLLLAGCLLLGLLTGEYAWALVLGLALLLAWTLRQSLRLQRWLSQSDPDAEPPEAYGFWGEIFDAIYRLQRRGQRRRGRLQSVIDRVQESTAALRDAVVMLDAEGNLDWWNPAAEALLGFRSPQDRGQPVCNLIRDPRFKEFFERAEPSELLDIPAPLGERRLQFQLTRYGEGEQLMLVRDVTRLHQLEQMRKDFVANLSHELRTPLTVLAGYLEAMRDSPDGLPPRWQRPLEQMQEQATRMQGLLTDLLLLARLEATDYPSDNAPVAVSPLLESICADARALSGERGHEITLHIETPSELKGSESELRSAFANLVVNAVNYTPAGGHIEVRWWEDADGGHLSVRDDGPGIEPRHLPRLTERFYRVDAGRSSASGGTGLGLAIVKHALLRHRGRLEIDSEPGQGSCFRCHFEARQLSRSTTATQV